jgi:hypothetical protein
VKARSWEAQALILLLLTALLQAAEQPVLLPLPDLWRRLEAQQEWLLLPQADYQALVAAGRDPAPTPQGAPAFLASAVISAQVVDGREIALSAEFTAINRGEGPALADLFATAPTCLGSIRLGAGPAVLAPGSPLRLLLPRPGRFVGTVHWTEPLSGDLHSRNARLPLPLAGGLSLQLSGDGRGSAVAAGLARDGAVWRLVAPVAGTLDLAWLPGGSGDDGPVFGLTQTLDVALVQDGPRPLRWVVELEARRGRPLQVLSVALPAGFTCTAAIGGVARLVPIAGGVEITRSAEAMTVTLDGLLAAGAPVALPRIAGASWQGGVVRLASDVALACEPPPGWRALGGTSTGRAFAVSGPDAGMVVEGLPAEAGLAISTSLAVAVGPERSTLEQVLLVRAGGVRLFRLPLLLPAGWRPTALSGAGVTVPPCDDLAPGSSLALDLPAGLAPGAELALLFTAEAGPLPPPALPLLVPGAARASHRLLLAAAPGLELAIDAPQWRLSPDEAAASGVRAELRRDGEATPVQLSATRREPAVDVEVVTWLLPGVDATWCRCDVRVVVRDGELARLDLDLPLIHEADLRLTGAGLTLAGAGPFTISAAKAWRGERVLRLEGRLRPTAAGTLPQPTARLPGASRQPVIRRWAALQTPGDRDLQLATAAAARPIDADELPAWATAIPGAAVVAAWRLTDGEAGGWRSADRTLAPLPPGFIDALDLATQISPESTRTRLACRLAAVGLAELDLGLPEGAVLEQAALDGAPAAVRRDGQRLLLALPGRTLVQVVLRYVSSEVSGHLSLPRLGGLPVTRCGWTVAVDPSLSATVLTEPILMPLAPTSRGPSRAWLGSWGSASTASVVVGSGLTPFVAPAPADSRALTPPTVPVRPACEPGLTLQGQLFSGTRSGAPQAAALALTPLADRRHADVLGRMLALLGGLAAVFLPRRGLRVLVPLAVAAIPLSLALVCWQLPLGPLLALAEWLPIAVALGLGARWLRLRPAVTLLGLACSLSAAEPLRLMGYDRLDAQGRPQGVVVALPRADFDALWLRAHGPAQPADPPVVLALGPPTIALTLVGTTVEGVLELPVAVPGTSWQALRLPLPGAVRALEVKALDATSAPAPRRVTWTADRDQLVLSLEGGQQAVIRIAFTLPSSEAAGGRRCRLNLAPGLGGRLGLSAPTPWRAAASSLALIGDTADLPTAGGPLELGWDLPAEAAPVDSRLSAEQRLSLSLEVGRVAWMAELDLASAGAPLRSVRLVPPAGLVLAEISGDGVDGWRRDGPVVVVTWAEPAASRRLHLAGVFPRGGGSGSAAVALAVSGAAVSRGRLGLASAVGERFLRPAGLASAEPAEGEALALRWDDQPAGLTVAWEEAQRELSVQRDLAVICGEGRARAVAVLTLGGRGSCDGLRLALAEPWRVSAVDGAATWAVSGTAAERDLLLAGTSPWAAGSTITVRLEADRGALAANPALPLLSAHGPGLSAGRLRLAVADAGAIRVHLEAGEARALAPDVVAQELARRGLALAPGERWRSAIDCDGAVAARPTLSLGSEAVQAGATLSHYLILGRDGLRWSLHLQVEPTQGALPGFNLTLPEGARLVAVSGLGLGRWARDGRKLNLAWAAPATAAAAIDLELDVPASADGSVRLAAVQLAGLRVSEQIALVEEDDLGLVRRETEGLGELEQPIARLPDGVERAQVRWLWKAARADWGLRLVREALAATAGADGLATLVDGTVTVAPDGEVRGLATWHVVNRSRQQLPLLLPAGVELWEARVDGQAVRVRRDAGGAQWLPVPPLRPGQASTRVTLVWRASPQPGGRIRLTPPALGELKLIASTWRLAAPAGWTLERRGGSLQEADPADAAADRAQAVIDEIQRLQAVDGLNEAGLKRLEGQLAVLDSELKDHLASLGRRAGPPASSLGLSKISSTSQAISDNSQRLGALQQEITSNYGHRSSRRKQLNIDALNQSWDHGPVVQSVQPLRASALDEPRRLVPAAWPWDEALAPGSGGGLGVGQAPPGLVAGGAAALSGIELVAEPSGPVLVLRGQGSALDAELELKPPRQPVLPWLFLACSGLALVAAGLVLRRRG